MSFLFLSEIMFESFNIPGLYIAVQVRIYCIIVSVCAGIGTVMRGQTPLGLLVSLSL